jgi:hypothetical protein
MLRHRKNHNKDITAKDLEEMDDSLFMFDKTFHKLIAPVMPSEGKTMKYHKLSHVTSSIRRLGNTREYDAQFYEASNKQQKASYNSTSKKMKGGKYLQEMAGHQEFRQSMANTSTFDPDSVVVHRNSAYLRASKSGENAMAEATWITVPSDLTTGEVSSKVTMFMTSVQDFAQICNAVRTAFKGNAPLLHIRRTAVLNATVPWLTEDNELQTIRAAPEFHGRPYYDSVVYRQKNGSLAYGLVRLIFKARDPSNNTLNELVCIQAYDKPQGVKDILTKAGCTSLTLTSRYVVVPLACLSQRIYVVPDFQRGAPGYHTCKWKWNRTPIQDY